MIVHVLNWIMLTLSLITAWLAWFIYKITRAKSLLYIFVAMCIGVGTRLIIAIWGNYKYSTYPSFVFWTLWTVGLYLLLRLLTKYMTTNGEHDKEEADKARAKGNVEGNIEGRAQGRQEGLNDLGQSLDDSNSKGGIQK